MAVDLKAEKLQRLFASRSQASTRAWTFPRWERSSPSGMGSPASTDWSGSWRRTVRQRIRSRYGAASLQAFDLLAGVGRDCVGAIQLLPEHDEPFSSGSIEGRPVDAHEIASLLSGITAVGLGANIAALDGHAKNFSVFIERGGRFRLTPLYDVLSAYPVLGHGSALIPGEKLKLAMAFSGKSRHYEWNRITLRHIRETARRCGMDGVIDTVIERLVENVPVAVARVSASLPGGFPVSVADPILTGLVERIKLLEAQ